MEHLQVGTSGALGMIGLPELVPILVIVLVLFGAKKLPELARAMGSSINQFKKGLSEEASEDPSQLTEGDRERNQGEVETAAPDRSSSEEEKTRVP